MHPALVTARRHLKRSALKLVGYLVVAYVVLKLIPALTSALDTLRHVSWEWMAGAIALEVLSECGFVAAWRAIVDPDRVLARDGGGLDRDVAWTQLGGGLLLPGGAWGGVGLGSWILHRFGMPTRVVAEREFSLSFLNTTVDALALILCGAGLATRIFAGSHSLLLTLLPAAVTAGAVVAVPIAARRLAVDAARIEAKHPKFASAVTTLAAAVNDTGRLFSRGGNRAAVIGIVAYLGCDVLVLWTAFLAIHAHPIPGFAVVVMAYIIGALGGSIPLPAAVGTIGGMVGMLIVYRVGHNAAVAAVLLHQAIGLLVPVVGGAIAYAILRHRLGPLRAPVSPPAPPSQ